MLFYISCFLFIFALLELDNLFNIKGLKPTVYIFIFLFYALRFDVGYDYMYYYSILTKTINFYDAMFNRLELLNRVLINISQAVHFPQFFFIITSFLLIYPLYLTIKNYSKDFALSTIIFLSFPIFFFNSLSVIRQYVAIGILFYAFKYIKSREFWKFTIFLVIAVLFHYSAIIGLLLYWVYYKKIETKYFILLFVFGIFSFDISFYVVKYLFPQYLEYLIDNIGIGGDKILIVFQIIGFLLLFFANKKKEANSDYNFYFTAFFIGLFIWSSLNRYGHAGLRGGLYFIIYFILLIPELLEAIKQKRLVRQFTYSLCFLFFVFSIYLGVKNPHKDPNIPYRIYFLTNKNVYKIPNE